MKVKKMTNEGLIEFLCSSPMAPQADHTQVSTELMKRISIKEIDELPPMARRYLLGTAYQPEP